MVQWQFILGTQICHILKICLDGVGLSCLFNLEKAIQYNKYILLGANLSILLWANVGVINAKFITKWQEALFHLICNKTYLSKGYFLPVNEIDKFSMQIVHEYFIVVFYCIAFYYPNRMCFVTMNTCRGIVMPRSH